MGASGMLGFGAASSVGPEAWARDMNDDTICNYKCMNYCSDRLRVGNNQREPLGPSVKNQVNSEYCQRTCKEYCSGSDKEMELKTKVAQGDMGSKIILKARKKTFDELRVNDKKVFEVDSRFGKSLMQNNITDYESKNGGKE